MIEPNISVTFFIYCVVGAFGLIIGSFLNVLAYRLPRNESIVLPASHCPSCGKPVRPWDNIPVISYILLAGRCRFCKIRISPVYPLVESFTAFMFVFLFVIHGPNIRFVSDAFLSCTLIVVFVTDIRHMIIPDLLTFPAGAIAVVLSIFSGVNGILRAFEGALLGFALILIMALMGRFLFKRESMGFGDFKLAFVTGLFLGPFWNLTALVLAIFIGGLWGIALMAIGKTESGKEIPFGPFIASGCFIVLIFRMTILSLMSRYLALF